MGRDGRGTNPVRIQCDFVTCFGIGSGHAYELPALYHVRSRKV